MSDRLESPPPAAPTDPRSLAKPGDILLFAGARGINRLIAWFGRTPYFHVAIYAGDDVIVEQRPSGVARRSLRENYGSHCIALLPAPGGRDDGLRALDWASAQIGAPYDPGDYVVIILEHIFRHLELNYAIRGRYTCGEFVALAWVRTGCVIFPGQDPASVEPADFAKLLPKGTRPKSWFGVGDRGGCR
jgi:uncharacterized protein YycO